VLSEIEAQWVNLRRGTHSLKPEEIESVAARLCSYYVARFGNKGADNVRAALESQSGDTLWSKGNLAELLEGLPPTNWLLRPVDRDGSLTRARDARVTELADAYLRTQGLAVHAYSRSRLVEAMVNAMEYGSRIVLLDDPNAYVFSPLPRWAARIAYPDRQFGHVANPIADRGHALPNRKQVPFDELFAGWVAEKQPREKTKYAWRRVLVQLGKFLGHSNSSLVSADDLIRWKASLLEAGLRAKSIRDGKLAPVRAILQWAVDNGRLSQNPAERVTIDLRSKLADKKRGYSEDEARKVLAAARTQKDALRRWVPWLCAYTGARVSEVCQLRVEDVVQQNGIWCVHFAPEAGALKNASSERAVPLHLALVEQGFLKFVKKVGSGPLFAEIKLDRFGSRGGNGTKVLSRWVRSLGLTDPRLSPSHSWRHRMRTLGRRYGLAPDILDAITGHQRKTVADTYGEFPVEALQREILKIPASDPS
jgi:integrase